MTTSNPNFVPPFAPVAPTAAPAVDGAEAPAKKTRKSSGERQVPNRQMTKDDILYVVANIKTKSYKEIADERNLTKHQVNRALMEAKKSLRESVADGDEARKAKVEAYIKEHLSRPEDTLPGQGGRKSEVKAAITDVVNDILGSL